MTQARSSARHPREHCLEHRPTALERDVANLSALDAKALKEQWRILWRGEPPPGLSRLFLLRAIAYRIQERAGGGLKPKMQRLLRELATEPEPPRPTRLPRSLQPGTILVREWHGTIHRVTVLKQGCTWRDRHYGSLSEVARKITGTRWSGPRFFGVRGRQGAERSGTT